VGNRLYGYCAALISTILPVERVSRLRPEFR